VPFSTKLLVDFPKGLTPKHKESFDLRHGTCQALNGAKLHITSINDKTGFTFSHPRVKGIGPRMSEVSDVTEAQVFFYGGRMGLETNSELSLAFVLCRLAFPLVD
jgi:hypothetical protein